MFSRLQSSPVSMVTAHSEQPHDVRLLSKRHCHQSNGMIAIPPLNYTDKLHGQTTTNLITVSHPFSFDSARVHCTTV